MKTIELGSTYSDRITGFKGVATGFVQYITGCNQVLLAPKSTDGKQSESAWIDVARLDLRDDCKITLKVEQANPGADKPAPIR